MEQVFGFDENKENNVYNLFYPEKDLIIDVSFLQ